jgi:hypothetical protein
LVRTRGRGYRDPVGEGVNGNEKKPRGIDGIDHIACEQIFRGACEPGRKQYRVRAIGVQGACGSVGDRGILNDLAVFEGKVSQVGNLERGSVGRMQRNRK